jgi:hypothetical protein
MIAERPTAARLRPVYHHPRLGGLATLDDNGPNGPKAYGKAREERLQKLHLDVIFPYEDGTLAVPDPPWLQSGNGAPVTGYDVRASKRHKGEHSDGPGILDPGAATLPALDATPAHRVFLPDAAPPYLATIAHYERVVDRLLTTGAINREQHLWMLRTVWQNGAAKFSHRGRYPASCANAMGLSDEATDRVWRTAIVTLFWELFPDGEEQ